MLSQRVISSWSEVEAVEEHGGNGEGDQGEHHYGSWAKHTGKWVNQNWRRITFYQKTSQFS